MVSVATARGGPASAASCGPRLLSGPRPAGSAGLGSVEGFALGRACARGTEDLVTRPWEGRGRPGRLWGGPGQSQHRASHCGPPARLPRARVKAVPLVSAPGLPRFSRPSRSGQAQLRTGLSEGFPGHAEGAAARATLGTTDVRERKTERQRQTEDRQREQRQRVTKEPQLAVTWLIPCVGLGRSDQAQPGGRGRQGAAVSGPGTACGSRRPHATSKASFPGPGQSVQVPVPRPAVAAGDQPAGDRR